MQIYCIQNKINGKCYVGQTRNTFKERYRNNSNWWNSIDNVILKKSIQKHGHENFEMKILEDNIESFEKLNESERIWAEKLNSYSPNGYNLRECGGSAGWISEEARKKMSEAKIGHFGYWNGKEFSKEHRENLSKAKKGKAPPNKGKPGQISWNKGVPMSEEAKQKVSNSKKGTPAWNKGKAHSETHKQALKEAWKRRKALAA